MTDSSDLTETHHVRSSSEYPSLVKGKWKNKQRILVFSTRGIFHRARHLMKDIASFMPHATSDTKLERRDPITVISEICEMKNCTKCVFFESRKGRDLYLWTSAIPNGPSAKFHVQNIHTLRELKMTGNSLKGSRPVLSFDSAFDSKPHLKLIKELFVQIFGTPRNHPKSQPFIDHIFSFSVHDKKIWFRNYQIVNGGESLLEIGPRLTLNLIKIFSGSFSGPVLYEDPNYVSPNLYRRMFRQKGATKYKERVLAKQSAAERKPEELVPVDPTNEVFETVAKKIKLNKADDDDDIDDDHEPVTYHTLNTRKRKNRRKDR